ncbi:MAG: DUF58 domain-containing protein, partial [Exiguobacterium acetylicum]
MQLIIPKGFNLIILTMTGASGVIVGLYGPVWIAALLLAYTLYGWVMPYYLEYVAKRIRVRLLETVRAFREETIQIPFELSNPTKLPLGRITISGLLGDQIKLPDASSQFWRQHLYVSKQTIVPFSIDVIAAHRGTIRIQSFDVMISDPFHLITIYVTLDIQELGHVFPDFAPASVEWNERMIPGETIDRSS